MNDALDHSLSEVCGKNKYRRTQQLTENNVKNIVHESSFAIADDIDEPADDIVEPADDIAYPADDIANIPSARRRHRLTRQTCCKMGKVC